MTLRLTFDVTADVWNLEYCAVHTRIQIGHISHVIRSTRPIVPWRLCRVTCAVPARRCCAVVRADRPTGAPAAMSAVTVVSHGQACGQCSESV